MQNALPSLFFLSFVQHLSFSTAKLLLPALTKYGFLLSEIKKERKKDSEGEVRGDGMQVFCHMTTGNKGRQRGVLISQQFTRECVCVWWGVFVYFLLKCTIVQQRGDCVYLSLFFQSWEEDRGGEKKIKQIFEEFDRANIKIRGILEVRKWKRVERNSC